MIEVTILNVDSELTRDEFNRLFALVSPEKQKIIGRYKVFHDARNSLLGDVLARVKICRVTGVNNKELEFAVNEHGKPFLINHPRVHYNISHTEDYIAFAIDSQAVGIDIETLKPTDMRIAERFFTPDETAYITGAPVESQYERFYRVWTMKESRIKWEGKGLSVPFPSFSVFDPDERKTVAYHEVFRNHEVICCVCAENREPPLVEIISLSSFWGSLGFRNTG